MARSASLPSTIATSQTEDSLTQRRGPPQALVDGFSSAFLVGAIFAAIGVVAALTLIRSKELETDIVPEPGTELVLDAA